MGKNMELKIAKTFAIILAASYLFFGICGVITAESNFFSLEVLSCSICVSLFYLFGIWLSTRRYKLLTALACLAGFLLLEIASFVDGNVVTDFRWKDIVVFILVFAENLLAQHQAEKLLKEEQNEIENNIKFDIEESKD